MIKRVFFILANSLILVSCATHIRSNLKTTEEFKVQMVNTDQSSRGLVDNLAEVALQGIFYGANALVNKTTKSYINNYSQTICLNDYYTSDAGEISKTYNEIHIKKYTKPQNNTQHKQLETFIKNDINDYDVTGASRGTTKQDIINTYIRNEDKNLLGFHAVIGLISDNENPSITRLSFNQLRVLFSNTKVFKDEDLNVKVAIKIEGQWRDKNGTPLSGVLVEQEYDFKKLKYGYNNLIKKPILSPWYYDIPMNTEVEDIYKFGVVNINVQVTEYEGSKSKYINQLPGILSDNKDSVISNGTSALQKILE